MCDPLRGLRRINSKSLDSTDGTYKCTKNYVPSKYYVKLVCYACVTADMVVVLYIVAILQKFGCNKLAALIKNVDFHLHESIFEQIEQKLS